LDSGFSVAGLIVTNCWPSAAGPNSPSMNSPYSPAIVAMSADSGAGTYSQTAGTADGSTAARPAAARPAAFRAFGALSALSALLAGFAGLAGGVVPAFWAISPP
jgi:hypothetical protein